MNIAVITAAGKGTRANLGMPKQFYSVNGGKPLLFYTIDAFEKCKSIDAILVVLDEYYYSIRNSIFNDGSFKKLKYFCVGGETNQMSIYNAFQFLDGFAEDDDIIIIHDGVRCLVTSDIIENNLLVCKKYGNAITCIPCNEALAYSTDGNSSCKFLDRDLIFKTQTPHSIYFADGKKILEKTLRAGIKNSVALCTMLISNGRDIYFSKGSNSNFKITQPEDLKLFESYIKTN